MASPTTIAIVGASLTGGTAAVTLRTRGSRASGAHRSGAGASVRAAPLSKEYLRGERELESFSSASPRCGRSRGLAGAWECLRRRSSSQPGRSCSRTARSGTTPCWSPPVGSRGGLRSPVSGCPESMTCVGSRNAEAIRADATPAACLRSRNGVHRLRDSRITPGTRARRRCSRALRGAARARSGSGGRRRDGKLHRDRGVDEPRPQCRSVRRQRAGRAGRHVVGRPPRLRSRGARCRDRTCRRRRCRNRRRARQRHSGGQLAGRTSKGSTRPATSRTTTIPSSVAFVSSIGSTRSSRVRPQLAA